MADVLLEVIYEGDHCIPCVYALETAEEAAAAFGGRVKVATVYLRQVEGALRYKILSYGLGKPAPIPSLFINGKLSFDYTPPVEELQDALRLALESGE
ncbi:MAG: hypothetical protein AB1556_06465 [Bacillota bacterium]